MKKEITLNVLKYTLGLVLFFMVSSCTDDMIDLNNVSQEESIAIQNASKTTVSGARIAAFSGLPLAGGGVYTVTLESVLNNSDGTFTWTWSVLNPNPGNGLKGTVQNLSHWAVKLGTCVTFADVVSGAFSSDGITWQSFTPTWESDPSFLNTCNVSTGNVLKFNLGTLGGSKSYYQLTINRDIEIDTDVLAYYKSGKNTPCGTFNFPGFGCERIAIECVESTATTAYAGNGVGGNATGQGNNMAWWYYLDINDGLANVTANIYKGQTNDIGDITYNAGTGMITITFINNWFLQTSNTESVKWYSYANGQLPTNGRPAPGQATNKGASLSFQAVNGHRFYAIHLDVATCE
ncbi:MAG: hypothetical protein Q8S44_08305 [Flavobacteriaceae bacterium]|nr:hypothetical protein [Flavobacteriaceae bacterium]